MNAEVRMFNAYRQKSPLSRWWNSRSFLQQRLLRSCLSLLVMIACFPLYYMGLFGTVDGPLNPARIGETLAGMGVAKEHGMVLFLSFLIISVSWNWIYNLVSLRTGRRLTCTCKTGDDGLVCGAQVKKTRIIRKRTGVQFDQYICTRGHKRSEAHFHPVEKGAVSHTLWIMSLCFCVIVFFMS